MNSATSPTTLQDRATSHDTSNRTGIISHHGEAVITQSISRSIQLSGWVSGSTTTRSASRMPRNPRSSPTVRSRERGIAAQASASALSEGNGRSQSERAVSVACVPPPCALAMRSAIDIGPLCASASHQSRKPSALNNPS